MRSADAFDAWMYRVVAHEAVRARRRDAERVAASPESMAAADGSSIDVWRALDTLSPPLRAVIVLFYFDDLKSEEIASILRVPHATVRTRLLRARDRLKIVLSDYAPASVRTGVSQHAF